MQGLLHIVIWAVKHIYLHLNEKSCVDAGGTTLDKLSLLFASYWSRKSSVMYLFNRNLLINIVLVFFIDKYKDFINIMYSICICMKCGLQSVLPLIKWPASQNNCSPPGLASALAPLYVTYVQLIVEHIFNSLPTAEAFPLSPWFLQLPRCL